MNCCKYNCGYLAAIVAIVAGVALGVLYALGFVATGVIFWAYLIAGFLAFRFLPVYYSCETCRTGGACVANYRGLIVASAIGTVVAAVVGLIVAPIASVVVVSIVLGVASFFVAFLLGILVCLSNCLCRS